MWQIGFIIESIGTTRTEGGEDSPSEQDERNVESSNLPLSLSHTHNISNDIIQRTGCSILLHRRH